LRRGVWSIRAHHFISLIHLDTLALNELEISQARNDVLSHTELDAHSVFGSFLDGERLLGKLLQLTGLAEIQNDIVTTFDFKGELQNVDLTNEPILSVTAGDRPKQLES